jgi:hypothetical protein
MADRPRAWLAGSIAAWSVLVVPAIIGACFAGRVFPTGPATPLEWVTLGLWVLFPVTVVSSIVLMWRGTRTDREGVGVAASVAPLVHLGMVALLAAALR